MEIHLSSRLEAASWRSWRQSNYEPGKGVRYGLRLQVGVRADKGNRNWEERGQMHYPYFLRMGSSIVR